MDIFSAAGGGCGFRGENGKHGDEQWTFLRRMAHPGPVDFSEEELRELIADGEGRSLEFKRGLPRDEKVARTLCAFANTRGGWLLVGVNDNRSLHGCPRPKAVMAQIRNIGRDCVSPPLDVLTTSVTCGESVVVAARVILSPKRPHHVLHGQGETETVIRLGSSNRVADGATLDALQAQRRASRSCDALETRVLDWVSTRNEEELHPGGDATPARFAKAFNIGLQRTRKAFMRLERDGLLVGHGPRAQRVFTLP